MPLDAATAALRRLERQTDQLENGLRMELVRLPHVQSATISFFVRCGSRYESAGNNGISHLLEHMLFRGSRNHPSAYELSLSIERLAGALDACTHVDFTQLDLTLPPENLVEGLARFAELLSIPIFDALDTEKRIIKEELLEDLDDSGKQIDPDNVVRQLLFAGHPLGFPVAGTVENIERLSIDAVRRHLEGYYTAPNSVVCVSGPIDVDEVREQVGAHFAGFRTGELRRCDPPHFNHDTDRFAYVYDDESQTQVRLSFPIFGLKDPRVMPLRLLERVLDDGLSTRLHRYVCDQLGIAYEASADAELYEDCGVFDFGALVRHEKVPELLTALFEVIDDLHANPITQDEISKAQARYIWSLRLLVDDPEDVNSFFGTNALFGLTETPRQLLKEAQSVDAQTLGEVAQSVFDRASVRLACVGVMSPELLDETRKIAGV